MNISIEELNQLMARAAKDAIDYLDRTHNEKVILNEASIKIVDSVLSKLAVEQLQKPMSQEHIFTVTSIFGAFIGEVFKKTVGGEWFQDTSDEKAPFVVLNYAGKSFPFASVCYQKLINQQEISVAKYYELAKSGSTM